MVRDKESKSKIEIAVKNSQTLNLILSQLKNQGDQI
jgi:hypothetical protein